MSLNLFATTLLLMMGMLLISEVSSLSKEMQMCMFNSLKQSSQQCGQMMAEMVSLKQKLGDFLKAPEPNLEEFKKLYISYFNQTMTSNDCFMVGLVSDCGKLSDNEEFIQHFGMFCTIEGGRLGEYLEECYQTMSSKIPWKDLMKQMKAVNMTNSVENIDKFMFCVGGGEDEMVNECATGVKLVRKSCGSDFATQYHQVTMKASCGDKQTSRQRPLPPLTVKDKGRNSAVSVVSGLSLMFIQMWWIGVK